MATPSIKKRNESVPLPPEVQRLVIAEATRVWNGGCKYVLLKRKGRRVRVESLQLDGAASEPK